jgi:3'-phosphoadenosine 5'-phosphosulfate sulfotransferase (PAPS reductase)/FAD synthetase
VVAVKTNPFRIHGPAVISFSGGRTSGYMLRQILDAGLRPDVHVLFCNTGKEYDETLDFVHQCEVHWGVEIHWLEYHRIYLPTYKSDDVRKIAERARLASGRIARPRPRGAREAGWREVDFETANRTGEPYRNFIDMNGLPNPATRTCTTELKVRVMKKWMIARGYKKWDSVVGIRADEPRRIAKLSRQPPERWTNVMPLARAGVTESDVFAFWRDQEFDLGLAHDPVLGTYRGNCDGCVLKATDKLLRIEREDPGRLEWWAEAERDAGSAFRRDRHGYARLRVLAPVLETCGVDDDLGSCTVCTD